MFFRVNSQFFLVPSPHFQEQAKELWLSLLCAGIFPIVGKQFAYATLTCPGVHYIWGMHRATSCKTVLQIFATIYF